MLVLFDQGTPLPLRNFLSGHTVKTVYQQRWSTLSNGEMIRAAEEAGFEVLLTTDKNLIHQQDLRNRKLAVVILSQARWKLVQEKMKEIVAAIGQAKPGSCAVVEISPH
jgi:hypothetical protein